jgi:5-methylcytosine-specific restriction endonuclease McrA
MSYKYSGKYIGKNAINFCVIDGCKNTVCYKNGKCHYHGHLGMKRNPHSKETKLILSINHKGIFEGDKHPLWKGGVSKDQKYLNNRLKEWRHKKGITKRYRREFLGGISSTKEYKKQYRLKNREKIRLFRKKYKYLRKNAGELSIKIIQKVYEENIKQYGTLTCVYCLKPIEFGKDTLEHKLPLSRGGTNAKENLGIACRSCNCQKHNKTVEEYREYINKKETLRKENLKT